MCCEAAIDRKRDTEHKARAGAAKPEDSRGDLVRPAETADRLIPHDFPHGITLLLKHVRYHRCIDCSWAHGVDANAPRRIFERCALGKADHAMLGRMVGRAAWKADKTPERRAVNDGAATLLPHLPELMLHAGPDAPEIDRIHTIEVLGRLVRCVARRDLNAGVVEGHVEPAEASNRAVDHRGDLSLVRYIAGNSNRLMTRRG